MVLKSAGEVCSEPDALTPCSKTVLFRTTISQERITLIVAFPHSLISPNYRYLSSGVANNKGADQPAHPRSLISALLFAIWEVSYVNLLKVKFQFSS